ncbi:MAG: DivIVA domain-containing protein [Candidatus Cloacimonetes bacterium]|nr:DivIVA domain-containing protein [Candidatus Cloacimonadota bacterium]
MRLNANDIRNFSFRKVMRGLDPEEVQAFLDTVAEQTGQREGELAESRARIEDLEQQLLNYRSMENGLRDTLIAVQNSSQETREHAQREAELILKQAELDASRISADARERLSSLRSDLHMLEEQRTSFVTRLRALLKGQIDLLEVLAAVRVEERPQERKVERVAPAALADPAPAIEETPAMPSTGGTVRENELKADPERSSHDHV